MRAQVANGWRWQVIDLSAAASVGDFRPSRLAVMLDVAQDFIREFFDQNPLSHLGIIIMRNGLAERLTELSSSPVQNPTIH
jgi:transcription initiation factor TFIIH subunit 2